MIEQDPKKNLITTHISGTKTNTKLDCDSSCLIKSHKKLNLRTTRINGNTSNEKKKTVIQMIY